jgi:hypothetical protein
MAAMDMVSAGEFSEGKLSFKMFVGGRLCNLQETPIFGSRRSKLDNLTVVHVRFLWEMLLNEATKRK